MRDSNNSRGGSRNRPSNSRRTVGKPKRKSRDFSDKNSDDKKPFKSDRFKRNDNSNDDKKPFKKRFDSDNKDVNPEKKSYSKDKYAPRDGDSKPSYRDRKNSSDRKDNRENHSERKFANKNRFDKEDANSKPSYYDRKN